MKPAPFEYHAPTEAGQAVALLEEFGDEAKVIAGGQSLMPMLALRLAVFDHLIDLGRIEGLTGIETTGGPDGRVRIGAGTTQAEIGRSALIAAEVPLLARSTPLIGHFQIRNRGTIGGSLAHADAAAEYPAVAVALDAELDILSPRGRRTASARGFFTGMWTTGLDADEVLTAVTFPRRPPRSGFAIREFASRRGDFALAGAAVAVGLGPDRTVGRAAIALFGVGQTPVRAPVAEAAVTGSALAGVDPAELGRAAVTGLDSVPSDQHAPAGYRLRVAAAMAEAAWRAAAAEAEASGAAA